MLNKLKRYLSDVIPDTQVTFMLSAVESMRLIQGDIIDFNIEQTLYQCRDMDNLTGVDLIRHSILEHLKESIVQYGIKLNEDTITTENIESLSMLLKGLIELETYEDREVILAIINSSDDVVECISEIIGLVTLTESIEYIPLIDSINPDIITKIKTLMMGLIDAEINDTPSTNLKADEKLTLFIQLGYHERVLPQLIDATKHQPHQLTLESILRLYGNQMADYTSSEYSWLYALFVAKNNPTIDYLVHIWDKYYLDELKLMDVHNRLTTLYQEVISKLPDIVEDVS